MTGTDHEQSDNEAVNLDEITVRINPKAQRFELLDKDTVIGATHWIPHQAPEGAQRIFYHTTVDKHYGGHGLASVLVREALNQSATDDVAVVAVCPYVKKWLDQHPEHPAQRITPRPEHLQALHTTRQL